MSLSFSAIHYAIGTQNSVGPGSLSEAVVTQTNITQLLCGLFHFVTHGRIPHFYVHLFLLF